MAVGLTPQKWACEFKDKNIIIGPFESKQKAIKYAFETCGIKPEKVGIYSFEFKNFGLENF